MKFLAKRCFPVALLLTVVTGGCTTWPPEFVGRLSGTSPAPSKPAAAADEPSTDDSKPQRREEPLYIE